MASLAPLERLTPQALASAIRRVLTRRAYHEAATLLGERVAAERDGVAETISILETYLAEQVETGAWRHNLERKWRDRLTFRGLSADGAGRKQRGGGGGVRALWRLSSASSRKVYPAPRVD